MDVVGDRYGCLVVVAEVERSIVGRSRRQVRVDCDCGKRGLVKRLEELRAGGTISCGCIRSARTAESNRERSGSRAIATSEYEAWASMKKRCLNPRHPAYRHYGGRGITIHDAWVHDFEAFFAYVGPKSSADLTLDRIDNEAGYVPGNVRWADWQTQQNNRRSSLPPLTYQGQTRTLTEWAQRFNIERKILYVRLTKSKWSIERALLTPVQTKKKKKVSSCG